MLVGLIHWLADYVTIALELNTQENLSLSLFDPPVKNYELDYYFPNDQNKLDLPDAYATYGLDPEAKVSRYSQGSLLDTTGILLYTLISLPIPIYRSLLSPLNRYPLLDE